MSNNMHRAHFPQSPLCGRFLCNFNGVEKKIILKRDKGEYQIDRVKNKVFAKFKKLGTKEFDIKMNNGSSINTESDIVSYLLGQQEPLPKCSVFLAIPRFESDMESLSKSDMDEHLPLYNQPPLLIHDNGLHNDSPISPLPISFDLCPPNLGNNNKRSDPSSNKSKKADVSSPKPPPQQQQHQRAPQHPFHDDTHQGHREYICVFNHVVTKLALSMYDIAKYSDQLFQDRFLSLFEYEMKANESLQFRVYHISTKQYIAVNSPLYSYDGQHYHIEADIVQKDENQNIGYIKNEKEEEDEENEAHDDEDGDDEDHNHDVDESDDIGVETVDDSYTVDHEEDRNHNDHDEDEEDDDDDDHDEDVEDEEDEDDWSAITMHDFQDILNGLHNDLKSQQNELELSISTLNENINTHNNGNFTSIDLWKKYSFQIGEIEQEINEFCNSCHLRLNHDLTQHLNQKCVKLKEICGKKLNKINELQHVMNREENEIIHLEKAIRQLTLQKLQYQQSLKSKQLRIKTEENEWKLSQKQLNKFQHFQSKYELTKNQLNENLIKFEQSEKLRIYDIQKHLKHVWNRFEFQYQAWNSLQALQWISCIENFYFSHDKFIPFIETLKSHQLTGKNLKELRANFTLNVMGLKHPNDQQVLIKHINRIITKSRRKSSRVRQQQIKQAIYSSADNRSPSMYKLKSKRLVNLPQLNDNDEILDNLNKLKINDSVQCVSSSSPPSGSRSSSLSSAGNLCCICAENEVNTVVIPCGHMVYCSECSSKLTINTCPTCRGKDVKIMTTYKSGL